MSKPKNCAMELRTSSYTFGFSPLFTSEHSTSSRTTAENEVYASARGRERTPVSAVATMSSGLHSPARIWCSRSHSARKSSVLVTLVTAPSSYA